MERRRASGSRQKTRSETAVLQLLKVRGTSSVTELSRISGLGKATVSRAITSLREQGLIDATDEDFRSKTLGRAGRSLRINPESGLYLGLAIGPGMINAVLADAAKQVVCYIHRAMSEDLPIEESISLAIEVADEALEEASKIRSNLIGIGIAIGAPVDPSTGVAIGSSLVPKWAGVRIREAVEKHFGLPAYIDNESNCSAMAELLWGDAPTDKTIAFVKFDRGVGGAVIFNGEVWRGFSGFAGEFGHIPYERTGPYCQCGGRGCFEKYISLGAFMEKINEVDGSLTFDDALERLASGDQAVARICRETGEVAGELLSVLARSINPDLFLLGGDMLQLGPVFIEAAVERYKSLNPLPAPIRTAAAARVLSGHRLLDEPALGAIGLVLKPTILQPVVLR